mgnify:CR=1 FL=1
MSSPIGRARSFVGVVVFGAGGDYVLGESLCESKGFCYEVKFCVHSFLFLAYPFRLPRIWECLLSSIGVLIFGFLPREAFRVLAEL